MNKAEMLSILPLDKAHYGGVELNVPSLWKRNLSEALGTDLASLIPKTTCKETTIIFTQPPTPTNKLSTILSPFISQLPASNGKFIPFFVLTNCLHAVP